MGKSKLKGNFLRDPESGILWCYTYAYDHAILLQTSGGVIDLAECEQENGTIVSIVDDKDFVPHSALFVARNTEGLYAVFAPYKTDMNLGTIYASITSGFTFKSVIGIDGKWGYCIVGQDTDGKWGVILISQYHNCSWIYERPFTIPMTIVEFEHRTKEEAMVFLISNDIFGSSCRDLSTEHGIHGDSKDFVFLGATLDEIKTRRKNLQSSNLEKKQIEFTPNNIQELSPNEVFVFGSNIEGHHGGGAASLAYEIFGAVWGLGVGLAGQSYAIPTMHGGVDAIKPYVDQFIEMAKVMKDKKFYVTRIGCGIAGFDEKDMAPLFREALELENVVLPMEFVMVLKK
jgi:hypothetical protein